MTQEEKELLLKDLCARLPYCPYVQLNPGAYNKPEKCWICGISGENIYLNVDSDPFSLHDFNILPYLRPMSSMTEEEFEQLKQYSGLEYDQLDLAEFPNNHKCLDFYLSEVPSYAVTLVFDWLNAHHFDYCLLIERGLALEAPEGMYKTE